MAKIILIFGLLVYLVANVMFSPFLLNERGDTRLPVWVLVALLCLSIALIIIGGFWE